MDKAFIEKLNHFIESVESEMDVMLSGPSSLCFLTNYKIIENVMSQKLSKNINMRVLCPQNEDAILITNHLVPFIGYRSIKLSLPKSLPNSILFIKDKQNLFSFSVKVQNHNQNQNQSNKHNSQVENHIFSLDSWAYSEVYAIVKNAVYCYDLIWEEKESNDKIIKEKMHTQLLFDLLSHDIGNYLQIIQNNLDIVTFNTADINFNVKAGPRKYEEIDSYLDSAKRAIEKSQSLLNNIRRLERLNTHKDMELILKNLPDSISNAYITLGQMLGSNNPLGKRIKYTLNVVDKNILLSEINIFAEDLLEEIFLNLFSNSIKYTETQEVRIDVEIREYFIAETRYWMVTVSDHGKGIPDLMKQELFDRFYSKATGSGLGLSIARTLVERYKGKIWVGDRIYEDYKLGSSFGMIFPAMK